MTAVIEDGDDHGFVDVHSLVQRGRGFKAWRSAAQFGPGCLD
jgi:hypothetical protein